MRWYIIKALLVKEGQRHLANRGGIALALLLVASAVLLSVFAPKEAAAGTGLSAEFITASLTTIAIRLSSSTSRSPGRRT